MFEFDIRSISDHSCQIILLNVSTALYRRGQMMRTHSFRRKGLAGIIIILSLAVLFSTAAICAAANGILQVTIEKSAQSPMAGIPVYLFTENGSYLGQHQTTDSQGKVAFNLAEGTYKIRVDYLGYKFWSPVYTINGDLSETLIIPYQDVNITVQGDIQLQYRFPT